MASKVKNLMLVGAFGLVGLALSCGEVQIEETIDPDVQLAEDIAIIEEYLASQGIVDYDTLETEVRVLIQDMGDGDPIEYQDIVWYDYIGRFIDGEIFDTSIGELALEQDQEMAIDTIFLKSQVNPEMDSLDSEGEPIIEDVTFQDGYAPVYSFTRTYEPFRTTHTPGGWFISQSKDPDVCNPSNTGFIPGFVDAAHYTLDNVNLNGNVRGFLPSQEAYRNCGPGGLESNIVLTFELIPVRKK